MVRIDLVGLALSVLLVGPRYAHLVLAAALLGDAGRYLAAVTLDVRVEQLRAAGVFSGLSPTAGGYPVVDLAGPVLVLLVAAGLGDGRLPPWTIVLDPLSRSDRPAVCVFLRYSALAALVFFARHWFK